MIPPKLLPLLACPTCHGALEVTETTLHCNACSADFIVQERVPHFVQNSHQATTHNDDLIHRLKLFFKRYPKIFSLLYYVLGAWTLGPSPKKFLPADGQGAVIINVGSGIKIIRRDVINIDFEPFTNVDVVGDVYALPFRSASVDMAISECVGEHLRNPDQSVKELFRVLKPGGRVYLSVPFIASFHSSPDDFFRFTHEGLGVMMERAGFSKEVVGIGAGPSSALSNILSEWLATLLSFGSMTLYQLWLMVFIILTTPLKIFDLALNFSPSSRHSAFLFYYVGRKV